jgi:tetratricopeptide (TPR) repeat protein
VRSGNPRVNAGLEDVIRQCLALHPDQRPASAQVLADALRRHFAPTAKFQRWARRRWFLIGGGVVAVGLIGGIAAANIAARVPYDVREYDAGIGAFHAQKWAESIDHFTRAHAARPEAWQPLFARAQALLAAGNDLEALPDLKTVYEMSPQGCTAAWLGYGNDRAGLYVPADMYYEIAINDYEYESVAIWNNRGYNASHRSSGRSAAIDHLTRALELDPLCQTAYHNRALVYSQPDNRVARTGVSRSQLAIQDIERAIGLGPVHGALMMDAAVIHWKHNKEADAQQRVVSYLQRALDLGFDRKNILQVSELGDEILAKIAEYPTSAQVVPSRELRMPLPNRFPPLFAQ